MLCFDFHRFFLRRKYFPKPERTWDFERSMGAPCQVQGLEHSPKQLKRPQANMHSSDVPTCPGRMESTWPIMGEVSALSNN